MTSVPIFIVAGQSNAQRPSIPLAVAAEAARNGGLIVSFSKAGSPLSGLVDTTGSGDWDASGAPGSGELLSELLRRVDALTNPDSPTHVPGSHVARMIWVQGEADAFRAEGYTAYEDNLLTLHQALTDRFGPFDLSVAGLSAAVWPVRQGRSDSGSAVVREAQFAVSGTADIVTVDPDKVALAFGLAVTEMFSDDFVHYEPDFAALFGWVLARAGGSVAPGTARLVVGTSGNDHLVAASTGLAQLFGSAGTDLADFSARAAGGILLRAGNDDRAEVRNLTGPTLQVLLNEVERLRGTGFDDHATLGLRLRDFRGEAGDDLVYGGYAGDAILLDAGDDRAVGNHGNDRIFGGTGRDFCAGGDGDDNLYGQKGDDRLFGGNGNDLLTGGADNDSIWLGGGADTARYIGGNNGRDVIAQFGPDDFLSFAGLDLRARQFRLTAQGDDLRIVLDSPRIDADILIRGAAGLLDADLGRGFISDQFIL